MASDSLKSKFQNPYQRVKSLLVRYSQRTSLVVGLIVATSSAVLWYNNKVGPIVGSLFIGIGSSVIAAAIVAFLSPFSEYAFRRFIALGIDKVWSSRETVPEHNWVQWVREAENSCILLGVAHGNWFDDDGFRPALIDRLKHGVSVKILFLNPNKPAAEIRAREEARGKHHRDTIQKIKNAIQRAWEIRETLEPGVKKRLRLYVYEATPSCGLTWVDDRMIVTHYLAGLVDLTSPAVLLKPAQIGMGGLFDVYAKNFAKIETEWTTELDERNIEQFVPKTQQEAVGLLGADTIPAQLIGEGSKDKDVSS
jgi:hypothetical protein